MHGVRGEIVNNMIFNLYFIYKIAFFAAAVWIYLSNWQRQRHAQIVCQHTQTSSSVHISSGACPEGMSNLRHLWLAGGEGWRKGKGEGGTWEEGGKMLTLTPSLCAANTGTN